MITRQNQRKVSGVKPTAALKGTTLQWPKILHICDICCSHCSLSYYIWPGDIPWLDEENLGVDPTQREQALQNPNFRNIPRNARTVESRVTKFVRTGQSMNRYHPSHSYVWGASKAPIFLHVEYLYSPMVVPSSTIYIRLIDTFGDRSFAVAGPRVWNSLPVHLRDDDITYGSFRRELKNFLF